MYNLIWFVTLSAGLTALHLAVQARSVECVEKLLETGVDVDAINRTNGRTALHTAVELNSVSICCKLIADVSGAWGRRDFPLTSPLIA